jgi:hypothetical protein
MRISRLCIAHLILLMVVQSASAVVVQAGVQDRAVLNLNFEGNGPSAAMPALSDSAKTGAGPDAVTLPSGGASIRDPFNPELQGTAVLLDAAAQQLISVASSADISRPDTVTIAGLFVNLHSPADNLFRGLWAKRQPDGTPGKTNYGINYNPSSDALQVYINDGSGFKIVTFSTKSSLGYRRRVHLAITFATGDAPGADSDTDADDVRVQLFVNGVALAPVFAPVQDGTVGWLTDIALSNCISDAPLTIGSSFQKGESARIICDAFQVFPEALSAADAAGLFREVTGAAAEILSAEQSEAAPADHSGPAIQMFSQYGLTVGQKNRIVVTGSHLDGATLHLAAIGVTTAAAEGSNSGQAIFEPEIPANTVPGRYLARVATSNGVSAPQLVSVDLLKQFTETAFPEASPVAELPVAISGIISGTEQKRVYFSGKTGQKVVAEVESRRLGSELDPVVEIKTASASPIAIQWQQPDLAGDARAVVSLPADGLYFVEIHDLQYRAPQGSYWRLLLGDLPSTSVMYPPVLTSASSSVRSAGLAGISEPVTLKSNGNRVVLESGKALLPLSSLLNQTGVDVNEPLEGSFDTTPVDAAFTTPPFKPVFINGRITKAGETDQVLLTVTPGQALHFSVDTRRFSSPLRAEFMVYSGDTLVASSNGNSGTTEAAADYTVAEGVTQLRVQIRDFTGRGSSAAVYRLQVARKDRPSFLLQTRDASIALPSNGSVPLRLSVVRQNPSFRYNGPIRLSVLGVTGVTLVPDQISASDQDQDLLVVLTRSAIAEAVPGGDIAMLEIEGQTQGLDPNVSSRMSVRLESLPAASLTFTDNAIVSRRAESAIGTVLLESIPPILFRGIPAVIPLRTLPFSQTSATFVRYHWITTEKSRPVDPQKPAYGNKPLIQAGPFQYSMMSNSVYPLQIMVPSDVAENVIDAAIGAEFISQPVASAQGATAWTAPIRLTVDNAATLTVSSEAVKAPRKSMVSITGSLRRHPQFSDAVTVTIEGLPAGFVAPAVSVAADSAAFTLAVTVPEQAAVGEVPNLTLRGLSVTGNAITPAVPVKLIVE